MSTLEASELRRARAASLFLDTALNRHPEWLEDEAFLRGRAAGETARRLREACADCAGEAELMRVLRQCRQFDMARIALRELSGLATFDETLIDLSDFADAACAQAADWSMARLHERYGAPRSRGGQAARPVVLGMGKLGGRELNFSSDIDLIAAYTAGGQTDGAKCIDNGQFFAKFVQDLARLLSARTEHGFVFRVDLMLRPFGSSGPPAISFSAAEQYYLEHGREWERYALIKARPVAGDLAAGAELLERLQPFVYRRYLDFTAIGSLRELKQRIKDDVTRRGDELSLKLGEGGIRELEFIVQSFQLVRGGQDSRLRDTRWRPVLRQLGRSEQIEAHKAEQLDDAYRFLRRLENAVQMYADQQTHALPERTEARQALLAAMSFPDWAALEQHLAGVRRLVHGEFQRVFAAAGDSRPEPPWSRLATAALSPEADSAHLAPDLVALGHASEDAASLAPLLAALGHSRRVRSLRETALPALRHALALLLCECARHEAKGLATRRVLKVVEAIIGRSTYLSLLCESATARSQLVRLCAASPWITDFIAQWPATLDMLLDARQLYEPPGYDRMAEELGARMAALRGEDDDGAAAMDALRRYRQETMLRIAAADVAGVLPLVKVSDQLTWLAEVVLQQALDCASAEMREQYGEPPSTPAPARLAVIGYGKFGGIELGYGSDLDLVFVYEAASIEAETVGGRRSLSTAAWFARLVQRLVHWLNTLTPAGRCYEVDLELRPSGRSGLVVSTLSGYADYQRKQAWTWEHQALTRARFVAGDHALGQRFQALRQDILCLPRETEKLRQEVLDMRERVRSQRARKAAGRWDIKLDAGGLMDIEFITQYLILREAAAHPSLARWSDNWRQLDALSEAGVIGAREKDRLIGIYRAYRQATHAAALQQSADSLVDEAEWRESREAVTALWHRVFEPA